MAHLAIIDIGSTSVGGALVKELPAATGESATSDFCERLIFTTREETSFPAKLDAARYLDKMTDLLKQSVQKLQSANHGAPAKIIAFLSAPFYATRIETLRKEATTPFTVTPRLLRELAEQEIGAWQKSSPHLFGAESVSQHEILENRALQVTLNGYLMDNPYGQKVNELALVHYLSLAAAPVLNRFREVLTGAWHRSDIEFHSFAYAFYRAWEQARPGEDCLVLDLGGEIAEVSLICRSALAQTFSFPRGRNWLVRRLVKEFGTTPTEAVAMLKLHLAGQAERAASKKIEAALGTAKAEWLTAWRAAVDKMLNRSLLPRSAFVLAEPVFAELWRRWLAEETFDNLAAGGQKAPFQLLTEAIFNPFCVHQKNVIHDLTLLIEAISCYP